ncbi:amino acid permease [Phenylobacterium sp. J367]|uniref:amino acid permease n=1 Tax=Phenylobacterium sp. J367 TaxID=2898435 RepID=UPI002150A02D|nr:amino acid permease [Phenylobacterium sp. J367]MCR5877992.1 amino acid permease [Phenylobacterium sp. J367]
MSFVTRRKPVEAAAHAEGAHRLKPTLGWPHLVALGVGAIIGTGIYTLTGVAAGLAGPAVILSFAVAGAVCAFAALCYAEMASLTPQAGSAYTYAYVSLGEMVAWVIGWSLILEYTLVCSAVSVGWAGYASGLIQQAGWPIPAALLAGPESGGIVNLPAVFIALVVTGLLLVGTRESATVNFILVIVKLVALAGFVALTLPAFDANHFEPFAPFGFGALTAEDGRKYGVMGAAAIIFFAFYGFDAISTAAEEAKDPKRDLTIGIVGSMALCTLIYMVVAAAALGAMPYDVFSKTAEPLAYILRELGRPAAASVIAGAAVIAMPTVIMVFMFGQSRVFFAMARDGLLPRRLATVSGRGVPTAVTLLTGLIAALIAGVVPLDEIAALANAGTLAAFIATAVAVMVLRRERPDLARPFRTPAVWVVAPLAVAGCLYLFTSLTVKTIVFFFAWNAVGVVVYLVWSRRQSRLA